MSDDQQRNLSTYKRVGEIEKGMDLRDWFAGMVVSGVVAAESQSGTVTVIYDRVATQAYGIADAMLKARSG